MNIIHKTYGGITASILEAIGKIAGSASDVSLAILTSGYGASSGKLMRRAEQFEAARERAKSRRNAQMRYANMLYKLKRDGLVIEKNVEKKRLLFLTPTGKRKLATLKAATARRMPLPTYTAMPSVTWTIISFDVPERERCKRSWLRHAIIQLGFSMVHQSVWLGKTKLPQAFLDDLSRLQMLDYIHIFEITKGGTLLQHA